MSSHHGGSHFSAVPRRVRGQGSPFGLLDSSRDLPAEALSVLRRVDALTGLPAATMATMSRVAQIADFEQGEVIYSLGEPIDSFCVVAQGRVLASCFSSSGRAMVKLIAQCGVFSELLVDQKDRGHCQVRAHVDTRLCRIPEAEFMRLCESDPALAIAFARIMTARWMQTLQDLEDTVFLNARRRVLKLLDKLSTETCERDLVAQRPLLGFCQDELARLAGITRERMNFILRELEIAGVIQIRPRALRVDSAKLARVLIDEGLQLGQIAAGTS